MVETRESPEVLLGKLKKDEKKLKGGLSNKASTCTHSLPAKVKSRRYLPGTGLICDTDHGGEGGLVAFEKTKTSPEDEIVQLGGKDAIFVKVWGKQASSLQTTVQGIGAHSKENEAPVVTLDYKTFSSPTEGGDVFIGLDKRSNTAESKNEEANQNTEDVPIALKGPDAAIVPMQRGHLTEASEMYFPLQHPESPGNKEVIGFDAASLAPVGASTGKDERDTGLEDKQKESTSLDDMTVRSREICRDTYQRLDNLEETIRELEMTISEISCQASTELIFAQNHIGPLGSENGKNGEWKVSTHVPKCSHAGSVVVQPYCHDLKQYEASNSTPKRLLQPALNLLCCPNLGSC